MSNQGYDEELQAERAYVASLYDRLAAERERANGAHVKALREPGHLLWERDVQAAQRAKAVAQLDVAYNGLCFGRLDALSGERTYLGRLGIFDEDNDYEPLLVDWRAPVASAFYCATAASPEGMARRRQFHTRGQRVVDFTDEFLGDSGGTRGDAALLAAVNAPRGDGMRDIVATIQAEQDEIIRLRHPGVVVVEGGPGTGKTAVALHRVAYLLYTKRERLQRRGVLVVGPSPAFLDHISRVLPSLGETDVVFQTPGDLVPGLNVTAEDEPELQRIKGSPAMLDVLVAAVADRQELPSEPVPVELTDGPVVLDADVARAARDEARATGLPHNEARPVFREAVRRGLAERAVDRIGEGWLSPSDGMRTELRAEVLAELADHEQLASALDRLWPLLTPRRLLAQLYSSRSRVAAAGGAPALYQARGAAWTVSDVPLLDEAVDLLGEDRSVERAAMRRARVEENYAAGVLDVLEVEETMDDEEQLTAADLLDERALAERHRERDNRALAERAAADRDWTYGHVVVDEAQELSEMDWRVLMRRCPSRSFTIVGDLVQRRSAAGARSWAEVLSRYVADRWVFRPLTVNYRTPAEIMAVAARLLAEFAPGVRPPESVRSCGVSPWSRRVSSYDLAISAFVDSEASREGTSVVIGPPGVAGTVPPSATKGLEYDAVLVVDPAGILAASSRGAAELYVALTRATQRLGIVHDGPLPAVLRAAVPEGGGRVSHRRYV
ncbi:RNA polymerase recycling motor ATPase HelR [Amycolatopsis sp. NPDC047767]|uniref:RNA polymerase recycling motor ATPase HelR n=1 Tax=Amycolatopsis sp. NPDC047767 TaxID=3156765 RepID=UPI003453A400